MIRRPPISTRTAHSFPRRRSSDLDEIDAEEQFRSLSALEDGDGKAANGTMVAARAREDEALAVRIMKARGYYDASAISTIDQRPDQPGRVSVTLSATQGHL